MSQSLSVVKEEEVVQRLFSYFTCFGYDRAKELAERERDAGRGSASPVWLAFLTIVAQLSPAEKLYMNLSFLTSKGFLRKESPVRITYESLLTDLAELEKKQVLYYGNPGSSSGGSVPSSPSSERILLHLCSHLMLFIQARIQLMAFYEKVVSMASGKFMNYDDLILDLSDIIKENSCHFHHPVLASLKTSFMYECDIFIHLLRSLREMQNWAFYPALLHLHDAHTKLSSWSVEVQSKETRKYAFGSGFLKSSPVPRLYNWLIQAKGALVAKFTLYFYGTLEAQTPSDMKNFLSRQTTDYVSKIQNFQRKSDAHSISLVFDTTGMKDFKGPGYHHPSEKPLHLTGLESFPDLFSYPTKPMNHWPSIVMRLSSYCNKLELSDEIMTFCDPDFGVTYFICCIEPRISLVVIFESQKREKESHIRDFVNELVTQLRCVKMFAGLKTR